MNDPKKYLQEANGFVRSAESNMFNGKNKEAVEMLKKAEELHKLSAQSLPNDPGLKTLSQKIEKIKKDLERKGISLNDENNAKLPFEVQSHISRIRALLISASQQSYLLEQAKAELKSYYSKFAGPMTAIPEIKEIESHIEKLEQELKEKEQQELKEKAIKEQEAKESEHLSEIWYNKLKEIPYFDGQTTYLPSLLEQKEHFNKATELMKLYEKSELKGQKSLMLESIESDIKSRIQLFPDNFNNSKSLIVNELIQNIQDKINFLKNDNSWQNDQNVTPYYYGKNELNEIKSKIEELKPLFYPLPTPENLQTTFRQLNDLNESRMEAKKDRIRLRPDLESINYNQEVKEKTKTIILDKFPNADIRKINIVKQWESKSEENWEDTTKTKWILKKFIETVVEAAIILDNNYCKKLTIHIEKTKQNDDSYDYSTGHIMYEDEMLVENI